MSHQIPRRPGNKVVRRRLAAREVIEISGDHPHQHRVSVTDHAKLFVLAVVVIFLAGSGLLMLPWATESGHRTSFIDALFTSVSAFSVTGLSTVDTQQHWSFFGEAVLLVLIQLGGFGFMVGTSLALIALGRGSSLRSDMLLQDGSPTLSLNEVSRLSLKIVRFMLISEVIGAIILTLHFMRFESFPVSIWWGIFHSVSAFCNAGFDLQGNFSSVIDHHESPVLLMTMAGLIQLGALSYMVLSDVWKHRKWKPLALDSKLVLITNFVLIAVASVAFLVVEWNSALAPLSDSWKPMNSLFQAIATRTAGFTSADLMSTNDSTMYLWIVIMMIGGAAGSTAGGVKLATIAVIVMAVASTVRGQTEVQAFGRRISPQVVFRAMSVVAIFFAVHFALSLLLVGSEDLFSDEGFSFLSLMFEAMSALATVGLSTGITPDLSSGGKTILILGMFIGRLGPITVAYALQHRQQRERFRFAEANIRIG